MVPVLSSAAPVPHHPGLATGSSGASLAAQSPEGAVPAGTGDTPSAEAPSKARTRLKALDAMGIVNLAGVIGNTARLDMRAGDSSRWAGVARFLP